MVLGEKTIREAVKTNKRKVFLMLLILFSFFLNLWSIPKIFRITDEYVKLEKKYAALAPHTASDVQVAEAKPQHAFPAGGASAPVKLQTPVASTSPPVYRVSGLVAGQEVGKHPTSEKSTKTAAAAQAASAERYDDWKTSFDKIKAVDDEDDEFASTSAPYKSR
jgi:hypothetical protein